MVQRRPSPISGVPPIPHDPGARDPSTEPPAESRSGPGDAEEPRRLTPLRERQLAQACQDGDPEALAELLDAYQRRVYAICYRMVRNRDEAADLTQDALIRIMEGIGGYDGRAAVSTWAIRVTINCCLSRLRREKLRRHGSLDEAGPTDEPWSASLANLGELSPHGHVEQAERKTALLRALGRLDPQMRAVLVLRDLQDLDYVQIGEVLDVPVGTVKSRLFRARTALRVATEAEMEPGRPGGRKEGDAGGAAE
jgi:RNA polymerase sigma-70 factor (ECF subfamily)